MGRAGATEHLLPKAHFEATLPSGERLRSLSSGCQLSPPWLTRQRHGALQQGRHVLKQQRVAREQRQAGQQGSAGQQRHLGGGRVCGWVFGGCTAWAGLQAVPRCACAAVVPLRTQPSHSHGARHKPGRSHLRADGRRQLLQHLVIVRHTPVSAVPASVGRGRQMESLRS